MSALLLTLLFAAAPATPAAKLYDGQLKMIEAEVLTLAEAMPADKYDFAATKGVRTFGEQVAHIAETNYQVASSIMGEKMPADAPVAKSLKTKDELVSYLKSSLVYSHKAVGSITEANLLQPVDSPFGDGKTTRMNLGSVFLWHSMDHYGQMVVYARLNGITPPASKN